MRTPDFVTSWGADIAGAAANQGGAAISANLDEIGGTIARVVSEIRQVLGNERAVDVQPWFTTNDGEGKKIVFRMKDGYEIRVLALSIPFDGYPVTIRVGDLTLQAPRGQLEVQLHTALSEPSVVSIAQQVKTTWAS